VRRFLIVGATAALLGALVPAGPAASQPGSTTSATVFAGGGTLLTNGLFFPGTLIKDGTVGEVSAPPVEVQKGTDFELVNLDEELVANAHKIQSFKRKKGRPLFMSDVVTSPGENSLVPTAHLKPGVYRYYCTVHGGMYGHIQIVKG